MSDDARGIPLLRRAFFFLRHGETESNVRGVVAGSTDVTLTALGHAQAQAACAPLHGRGITAIYTSPLRRARDTAVYIAQSLGLPVAVIPELAERNWGILEGEPRERRVHGVTPPGAESPEAFAGRVTRGLAGIESDVPLIVAHSGVFRVLCRTLGVSEPPEPVSNARPVHCRPPEKGGSPWRFEFL